MSPATVSRYLNGRYEAMSAETRERVAEVIRQTGYRPSAAARSLRTDRSNTIGVVMADITNPYSGAMLEELDRRAAPLGYSLMTAASGNDARREDEAIRRLLAAGIDGLVVNSCATGTDEAAALVEASRTVPVVLLDRDVPGTGLGLVTSDNARLVGELATQMGLGGARRAYLLTERNATSDVRRERAEAFAAALEAASLEGGVAALGPAAEQNAEVLRGLLGDGRDLAGLVAVNGLVLLRLAEALEALGTHVPQDALVATFDDYAWNRVLFGGITTAVQDTAAIAEVAMAWLLSPDEPQARRREVPGHVIVRASTRGTAGQKAGREGSAQ